MSGEPYSCEQAVPIDEEPRHHLIIANEFVRAFAVEIAPHERTLCHHHPHDYLLYSASDAEIVSAARGEEPKRLSYGEGECELAPAGLTHVVENLGDRRFRNVVVELLPRRDLLRRGASPLCAGGGVQVEQILDEDRAAIFTVQIGPGAEVEISGPAIVATPYANNLNSAYVGEIDVKQNEVCDLAWVPCEQRAILWGCRQETERAIVFQIGYSNEQGLAVPNTSKPVKSLRAHADEPE